MGVCPRFTAIPETSDTDVAVAAARVVTRRGFRLARAVHLPQSPRTKGNPMSPTAERLQTLVTESQSALMNGELDRAEMAVTGLRHVIERHPEIEHADSWRVIHRHLERSLEEDRGL